MAVLLNYDAGGAQWGAIGDLGGQDYYIAMAFTPDANWTVTDIKIVARGGTDGRSTPTDGITLRVETDTPGSPSGTLAHANASGTIAAFVGAYADRTCTFASSFPLANATKYWIFTSVPLQANDTCYEWEGVSPETYAGGNGMYKPVGGAWTLWGASPNGYDLSFEIDGTVGWASGAVQPGPTLTLLNVG